MFLRKGKDYSELANEGVRTTLRELKEELRDLWCSNYIKEGGIVENPQYQDFELLWNEVLEPQLSEQIKRFAPEKMIQELLKRHPWMLQDENAKYFVINFLHSQLKECLQIFLKPQGFNQWNNFPFERFLEKKNPPEWKSPDSEWLAKKIESYPFTNTTKLYRSLDTTMSIYRASYPSLLSSTSPNQPLRRLDLWRFLITQGLTEAKNMDGLISTSIAPLSLDELQYLPQKDPRWKHLGCVFVNLGDENEPVWVVVHRNKESQWTLYHPAEALIPKAMIDKLHKQFPFPLNAIQVDYSGNERFNDIQSPVDFTERSKWQAVLFSRVLPSLVQGKELKNFRHEVPLSLLWQETMESCVTTDKEEKYVNRNRAEMRERFLERPPFSNQSLSALFNENVRQKADFRSLSSTWGRYSGFTYGLPSFSATRVLQALDSGRLKLTEEKGEKILTISPPPEQLEPELYLDALMLVYYNKVTHFSYPPLTIELGYPIDEVDINTERIRNLLDHDLFIKTIIPQGKEKNLSSYQYPLYCAARNRFLESRQALKEDIVERKKHWDRTGFELAEFYKNRSPVNEPKFVNELLAFKRQWHQKNCDYLEEKNLGNTELWQFLQVTEMGKMGITSLFWELKSRKKGAASINGFFDLSGDFLYQKLADQKEEKNRAIEHLADYIDTLTYQISNYESKKDSPPLFNSLELILPDTLDSELIQEKLMELFKSLPEDLGEVRLYQSVLNLDLQFLQKLETLAEEGLQVLITIPALEEQAFLTEEGIRIKERYQSLQNKIQDNQRKSRQEQLKEAEVTLRACQQNQVVASQKVAESKFLQAQPWGKSLRYPIGGSQEPGFQYQMQEQVKQEFKQGEEHKKQQQQQEAQERQTKISRHPRSDEADLITRETIDARFQSIWEKIPESIKKRSGWNEKDLSQLFSLWVTTDKRTRYSIDKMEPAAVKELMENAPQFRMGLSRNYLPPGFSLTYSRHNESIILCFDPEQKKIELQQYQAKKLKEGDPAILQTRHFSAKKWKGDYRQLAPLSDDPHKQQTLWRFLAEEDQNEEGMKNARMAYEAKASESKELEKKISDDVLPVTMQRFNVTREIHLPGDFQASLVYLKEWSRTQKISPELLTILFGDDGNEAQTASLSAKNLKAFGQLFNHYDTEDPHDLKSSILWLALADEVYKRSGPEGFAIWKQYVLDQSDNWSEMLDGKEIEAMSESLVSLNKTQRDLWLNVVKAHGEATGSVRYAQLWVVYEKVLKLLNDNNLHFNPESLERYLDKDRNPNFNAYLFLEHLQAVLIKIGGQKLLETQSLQQEILDNIDQIDWRFSGFYSACRFNNYPYWRASLSLNNLQSTTEGEPSYDSAWSPDLLVKNPKLHCLRFAAQKLRLSSDNMKRFEEILQHFPDNAPSGLFRLFAISIANGTSQLENFPLELAKAIFLREDPGFISFVQKINSILILDDHLRSKKFQLRLEDLPFLYQAMRDAGRLLNTEFELEMYGRALQYFTEPNRHEKFSRFLRLKGDALYYPWLFQELEVKSEKEPERLDFLSQDDKNMVERAKFWSQMQTVDYSKSTYYPNREALSEAFHKIATATKPAEMRSQIIGDWVGQGCAIREQHARFNPLDALTIQNIQEKLKAECQSLFYRQNAQLLNKLLASVAIDTQSDLKQQVDQFCHLLIRLDNKPYYNELAQLFSTLLKAATSKDQPQYYALPQLLRWLQILVNEESMDRLHYPVDLLKDILNFHLENAASGLLSNQLQQLKSEPGPIITNVKELSNTKLTNHSKKILLQLLLVKNRGLSYIEKTRDALQKLEEREENQAYINDLSKLILKLPEGSFSSSQFLKLFGNTFKDQSLVAEEASDLIKALWQSAQHKLLHLLSQKLEDQEALYQLFFPDNNAKSTYIFIILAHLIHVEKFDLQSIDQLKAKLGTWDKDELQKLAESFQSEVHPSVTQLTKILDTYPEFKTASQIINHFEKVEQGLKENGKPKRKYSIKERDQEKLLRILTNIKRKGEGEDESLSKEEQDSLLNLLYYANHYSHENELETLSTEDLNNKLAAARKSLLESKEEDKPYASARVHACMREIMLRKTGKWVNHTQFLDLLYAAMYNDESLLHQVRTGEGKSLISAMRTGYLALNGYVVDVFSSKESLSERDYLEMNEALSALGVQTSYITADSKASEYKDKVNKDGIGAVNYATLGNWSLFHSKHTWEGKHSFNLDPKKRVAYLDECDYLLTDEKTQYNYAAHTDKDGGVYNYDAWIYYIAYDYYLEIISESKEILNEFTTFHLKELCKRLQEQAAMSPSQSRFFERYMLDALSGQEEDIQKRDDALVELLHAAHQAHHLKRDSKDSGFAVCEDQKKVRGGVLLDTRFAKVVTQNQIREGSTYNGLIHQFLHVRHNREAIGKGGSPNFFIDPVSRIVLSLNAPYILKTYYSKIEGASGTPGNRKKLGFYKNEFGIQHVIKMPTHKTPKTTYLPTIYADGINAQVEGIVQAILFNAEAKPDKVQPILITCRDDGEVKRLKKLVKKRIKEHNRVHPDKFFDPNKIISFTNGDGKQESDILPLAAKQGVVTFSARLGRGTDIPVKKKVVIEGLHVLRTYPDVPEVVKQERGRQGRYGSKGSCQEIIDYTAVEKAYEAYQKSPGLSRRIQEIIETEKYHLKAKLQKQKNKDALKWQWLIKDEVAQNKYILARSVERLNYELKEEKSQYVRRKESLIATLSGEAKRELDHQIILGKGEYNPLQNAFADCLKDIEAAWSMRLACKPGEKKEDSEEVYQAFFEKACNRWEKLCKSYPDLDRTVLQPKSKASKPIVKAEKKADVSNVDNLSTVLQFYQVWLKGSQTVFSERKAEEKSELQKTVYGGKGSSLEKFYKILKNLPTSNQALLIKTLSPFLKNSPYSLNLVRVASLTYMIEHLSQENMNDQLRCFEIFFKHELFQNNSKPYTPQDLEKNSRLLMFITSISSNKADVSDEFIRHLCQVIRKEFWSDFDEDLCSELKAIFISDKKITALFTSFTKPSDINLLIDFVRENLTSRQASEKREQLHAFLENHSEEEKLTYKDILLQRPELAKSVLELAISNRGLSDTLNYLPPLNIVNPEMLEKFWFFLTKRMPIVKADCDALLQLINTRPENNTVLMEAIFALPPFVTLSDIHDSLKDQANWTLGIQLLHQKGILFNQFLEATQLAKGGYSTQNRQDIIRSWLSFFRKFNPEQYDHFFNLAIKYSKLSQEVLQNLSTAVPVVTFDNLKTLFTFANIASQLNEAKRDFILKHFCSLLSEGLPQGELMRRQGELATFATAIKNEKNENLTLEDLTHLYSQWQSSGKDAKLLQQSVYQFAEFKLLDTRCPKLGELYRAQPWTRDFNRRCLEFSSAMEQPENKRINPETLNSLASAYIESKAISDETQLENALSVARDASQLELGEMKLGDLFSSLRVNQERRQKLMQHLNHDLIDLGAGFSRRCEEKHQALAKQLLHEIPRSSIPSNDRERAQQISSWHDYYSNLLQFSNELASISKHPYTGQPKFQEVKSQENRFESKTEEKIEEKKQEIKLPDYLSFFKSQKDRYSGYKRTNTLRRTQAEALFKELDQIANKNPTHDSPAKMYISILTSLQKTQMDILKKDKTTKYNKKGYSRLLDITVEMFAKVSADFMNDPNVSREEKHELNTFLAHQRDYFVETLKERLPNKLDSLKEKLNDPRNLPEVLKEFEEKRKQIPKELHYLFDNLNRFITLEDSSVRRGRQNN